MRTTVMAAAMALAAGGAGAATLLPVTIDFEDVALGSYTEITTGGFTFASDAGFEVVQGDPFGGTGNTTRMLYSAAGAAVTITQVEPAAFTIGAFPVVGEVDEDSGPGSLRLRYAVDVDGTPLPTGAGFRLASEDPPFAVDFGLSAEAFGNFAVASPLVMEIVPAGFTPVSGRFAFDDLVFDPFVPTVPLPATGLLLVGAIATLGVSRRLKR